MSKPLLVPPIGTPPPKSKANGKSPHGLNAIGKPYGAQYDPNYRMRYRTPRLKRAQGRIVAVTPERWAQLVTTAAAAWKKHGGPTPPQHDKTSSLGWPRKGGTA